LEPLRDGTRRDAASGAAGRTGHGAAALSVAR
jgi:hypothetical protein